MLLPFYSSQCRNKALPYFQEWELCLVTYDEHNNVISEHTLGVYGTSGGSSEIWINYSYIYDSYGNVLKKTWVETYVGDGANEQHGYGVSDYEYN